MQFECTVDNWSGVKFVDCDQVKAYIAPTQPGQKPVENPFQEGKYVVNVDENGKELCIWTGSLDKKMEKDVVIECLEFHKNEIKTHIHTR